MIRMQWIQRSALEALLIVFVFAGATSAQQRNVQSVDSLIIGKTIVRLGTSKDSIFPALTLQYVVKPIFSNCTDLAPCRAYNIFESDNFPFGFLEFDTDWKLVKASVELLPGLRYHSEGEIGKTLVSAIAQ